MTIQTFLNFLFNFLDRMSPIFDYPIFQVPVFICFTCGAVSFIKYLINGGLSNV